MKMFIQAFLIIILNLSLPTWIIAEGKFVPPKGKTVFVIGQDIKNISDYLRSVNHKPAGFSVYTSAEFADGLETKVDHGGGIQHAQVLVDRYQQSVILVGLWMVDTLQKINHGDVDESLQYMAEFFRDIKRPVYLRIGYEFDFPENNYDPEEYKKAYRRIVDVFKKYRATNVAFVWHSYAVPTKKNILEWYPGHDVVDWVGLSYFRNPKRSREHVVKVAQELGKPIMIAEASPWHLSTEHGQKTWDAWFKDLFKFIEDNDVRLVGYINCNWDEIPLFATQGWGENRIQKSIELKNLWLNELSKDRYLMSSPDLYRQLGFSVK